MLRCTDTGVETHRSSASSGYKREAPLEQVLPRVVIVGRPNAGKSTLFNRLAGRRKAVVDRAPGLTRDLNVEVVCWEGRSLELVDTGGLQFPLPANGGIEEKVRGQCVAALEQAQAVICVFDGRAGWSPADGETVALLRQAGVDVVWAVNKLDCAAHDARLADFYRCGAEEILGVSAAHGRGIDDLVHRLLAAIPPGPAAAKSAGPVAVAIVGRPNVGKSSLLNRLLGSERAIVDDEAGTTRDAIDTPFTWEGHHYVLVDTAGIRRRPRVTSNLEKLFVSKAIESLERSQIALLVMEATCGVTAQDLRLCSLARSLGRGLVAVMNKCDIAGADRRGFGERLSQRYSTLDWAPLLTVSAREGTGVPEIMPVVNRVAEARGRTLETRALNRFLADAVGAHEPPARRGRGAKLFYAVQVGCEPPHILIFCSYPDAIDAAYSRYLERRMRQAFDLAGTPVRLTFRRRR